MTTHSVKTHQLCLVVLTALFVFAAAFTRAGEVRAASDQGRPAKSMHYVFAHRFLPQLVHEQPQLALALAMAKEKEKLLAAIWDNCQEAFPDIAQQKPEGLSTAGQLVTDDTLITLLTMPAPQEMPEAYYVCMIVPFTVESDNTLKATGVTYYTLEKTMDFDSRGEDAGQGGIDGAAPTVIGGWTKEGSHLNFGPGPAPDSVESFIVAVLRLHINSRR